MSQRTTRPTGTNPTNTSGAPQAPEFLRTTSPRPKGGHLMTRRAALKAMLGLGVVTAGLFGNATSAFAAKASQETTDALNAAQAAYDEAQDKLNDIADEVEQLNAELADTVSQIDEVTANISAKQDEIDQKQDEIDRKQDEIDQKQAEIDTNQDILSGRIASSYKAGTSDLLSILLNSTSFEELQSNLVYLGKINESDERLIDSVKTAKAQLVTAKGELEAAKSLLEAAKADLESQKSSLEDLKARQSEQLSETQAKQQEASDVLASLSDDVRELVEKRDAEILAAAEEERRQAEAQKQAQQQQQNSGGGSSSSGVTGSLSGASASAKGAAIVAACSQVASPGLGLCAMWVSRVYQKAGLGYPGGNANNMYYNYCSSSNKGDLQPGMIIAVPSHPHTAAGRIYGHVGIYIGNGTVMHNIGSISRQSLDSWISYYGTTYTPRWGWAA